MEVRLRRDLDLDACERLATEVHRRDGYPRHLPQSLRSFLASADALAAWVGVDEGEVVGHVALHARSSDPVMRIAAAETGRHEDRLAVVARLLVARSTRRSGLGRDLLATATRAAHQRGRRPVLDVAMPRPDAVALYEACGWVRAGEVNVTFADGTNLDELVYLGPEP